VTAGKPVVTYVIIALCALVYALQWIVPNDGIYQQLAYAPALTGVEPWRMLTSAFLHSQGFLLHIVLNMYTLWIFGQILEPLLGHARFLAIYLLSAVGGSVGFLLLTPVYPVNGPVGLVGASGAIFGLFGLAFVVSRRRHLLLGPQARAMLSQVGALLVINLIFTFTFPGISWTGHIGGLLVGGLIGLLLPPTNVPTMGGVWRAPDGRQVAGATPAFVRAGAYLLVGVILAAGAFYAVNQIG
jgi:membrane associated rhomboid family serine protease